MLDLAQQGVDLKQRDVDRKTTLAKSNFGSQLDLDNAGDRAGHRERAAAIPQAAALERENPVARQSRSAARGISALCPGQGGAGHRRSAISTTP